MFVFLFFLSISDYLYLQFMCWSLYLSYISFTFRLSPRFSSSGSISLSSLSFSFSLSSPISSTLSFTLVCGLSFVFFSLSLFHSPTLLLPSFAFILSPTVYLVLFLSHLSLSPSSVSLYLFGNL